MIAMGGTRRTAGAGRVLVVSALSTLALLLAPAAAQAAPKCFGLRATIVGTAGKDKLTGKKAPDVIVTKGGDDVINGFRGNDRICAGPGDDTIMGFRGTDRISGDEGNDFINGEKGTDHLFGGVGTDVLIGDRGSDEMDGGPGDGDVVTGDKGNDNLLGGDGNGDTVDGGLGDDTGDGGPGDGDRVIGGLGADHLSGGDGNGDVVRGDDSTDTIDGGPGAQDIASFALATPPGTGTFDGVVVNLATGSAQGDGFDKIAGGIEDVAGSPFADRLIGDGADNRIDGGPGNDTLEGGGGTDTAFGGGGSNICRDFASEDSCSGQTPPAGPGGTTVELSRGIDGDTLTIIGDDSSNKVGVSVSGTTFAVTDGTSGVNAAPPNCTPDNPTFATTANCVAPEPLNAIIVSLGGGADSFDVGGSLPASLVIRANGGTGDDLLNGGPGADTLEAGDGGNDVLNGGPGSDGLVSGPGADQLNGGDGSDLLIVDTACGGHVMNGGAAVDNASFARIPTAVIATVGGTATSGAGDCNATRLIDAENIEGSNASDTLIGGGGANGFFGRSGDDVIKGKGGRDNLDGVEGADTLLGGGGEDSITARDGLRDSRISCGPGLDGEEHATRDRIDPKAKSC